MSDVTLNTAGRYAESGAELRKPDSERWSAGRSLRFVVYSSLGLWAVIIATVVSLI